MYKRMRANGKSWDVPNIKLYHSNTFINVYKDFFDKYYTRWLKDLLPLSIEDTQYNASNFYLW